MSVLFEVLEAQHQRVGEAVVNNKYTAYTKDGCAIALTTKGIKVLDTLSKPQRAALFHSAQYMCCCVGSASRILPTSGVI